MLKLDPVGLAYKALKFSVYQYAQIFHYAEQGIPVTLRDFSPSTLIFSFPCLTPCHGGRVGGESRQSNIQGLIHYVSVVHNRCHCHGPS